MSDRCNLTCTRCWFHGDSGVGDAYAGAELSTAEVVGFIDQVAGYGPSLYLGGGEPLLRDDLVPILTHAKNRGLSVSFTTNGTLIDAAMAKQIASIGVDHISVSIDGPQPVHDALRGPGTFALATAGLKHLLEARSQDRAGAGGAHRPALTVNMTVGSLVAGRLAETIAAVDAAVAGVAPVEGAAVDFRIHHLWYIDQADLQAHQAAVNEALGASAAGAGAHLLPGGPAIDAGALSAEISGLRGRKDVMSFPDLRGRQLHDFYSSGHPSRRKCRAPLHGVVIKPNGNVRFCPDEWIDDYVLGNIREQDLETIWNGERARRFRSVLLEKGSFPGCRRCSWMYSF